MDKIFSDIHFEKFSRLIQDKLGIHLTMAKKEMLQTRLIKLMTKKEIHSYTEYLALLEWDTESMAEFTDAITINKTDFFREINHFHFLQKSFGLIVQKNPRIMERRELRVWSAGCSTGEEPYTLAMVLSECVPSGVQIKILATDLNRVNLSKASRGVYPAGIRSDVDPVYLQRYFIKDGDNYQVNHELKQLITFRQFNLQHVFPFKGTFDIIFCRNVMIYFDSNVQQRLITKYYNVLTQGGLLFIGHSESLTGKAHRFQYLQPTIYVK